MSTKNLAEVPGQQAAGMLTDNDTRREEVETERQVGEANEFANQTVNDAQEATHVALGKPKQAAGHTMMKIFRWDQSHHSIGAT